MDLKEREDGGTGQHLKHHQTFFDLIKNSPLGVYVVDGDFRLWLVSLGAQKVFQNVRPLIGRDFAEVLRIVWPEPFATEAIGRFRHTLETGEQYRAPNTVERRGDIQEIESYDWMIERVTLPDGSNGVVCYFYDMTERLRAEQALRESEQKFSSVFHEAPFAMSLADLPDGRYVDVNAAWLRLFDLSREEVIGKTSIELGLTEHPSEREALIEETLTRGRSGRQELTSRSRSGRALVLAQTAERIMLGDSPYALSCLEDITARREAEATLTQREAQLRTVFESLQEGVVIADASGYLLDWNPAAVEMHGFSGLPEAVGQLEKIAELFELRTLDGDLLPLSEWPISKLMRGETISAWDLRVTRKDQGLSGIFSYSGAPVFAEDQIKLLVITMQDVTAQRSADAAQRASADRFAALARQLNTIADTAPVYIAQCDKDYRYLFVNQGYVGRLGLSKEQVVGRTIAEVLGDETFALIKEHCDRALEGHSVRFETEVPYRDIGTRFMNVAYEPDRDAEGNILSFVATVVDITPRYEAEREIQRLNEELESKVRDRTHDLLVANEQLQGFTYSVAHDLRQQIRGISTNAAMILQDTDSALNSDSKLSLERLIISSRQLAVLVDDLLRYARLGRQDPRREPVDISALFQRAANEIRSGDVAEQTTVVDIQPGMEALGDPSLLGIVAHNLLDNAFKYSRQVERPSIRVGVRDASFYVQDNGVGFSMAYAEKVFVPFERLHTDYPGTGIGLANVKRIIEKHGGRVWVESEPGKGSTFLFSLR